MIAAVIFDMDGLLIDSEPLWERASIESLAEVGVHITVEQENVAKGMRIDESVATFAKLYPWEGRTHAEMQDRIISRVIELIEAEGGPMVGVDEVMTLLRDENIPLAIASSSLDTVIDAVLTKIDVRHHMKVVHSAEHEEFGKPHPSVYITAAKKLGVDPTDCVVLEDSVNGVLAAKAAKMACIAIPEPGAASDPRFGIADHVVASLHEVNHDLLATLGHKRAA